jgi:hypothetical protein
MKNKQQIKQIERIMRRHKVVTRWQAGTPALPIFALMLMVGLGSPTYAATAIYVDASRDYRPTTGSWGYAGMPPQPDVMWYAGNGINYNWVGGNASSGYINDGTLSLATPLIDANTPNLGEGILAAGQQSWAFNGTTNYLWINSSSVLDWGATGKSFSVAAWVNLNATGASCSIISKRTSISANSTGWMLCLFNSGVNWIFNVANGSYSCQPSVSAVAREWTLLVGTWDNVTKTASIYVNGSANFDSQTTAGVDTFNTAGKVMIGKVGGSGLFPGQICWTAIWQDAILTAAQIDSMYGYMHPTGSSSRPYPSIQSAISQANNSGARTLLVAPGLYRETVDVLNDSLTLTASDEAFGNRPVILGAGLPAAAGTVGLTLLAKTSVSFLDVRGFSSGKGVLGDSISDGSMLHHLVIDSCLTGVRFYGSSNGDTLANCTIDGEGLNSSYGVRTVNGLVNPSAATLVLLNNLICNCTNGVAATDSFSVICDYNDLHNCSTPYSGLTAGGNSLELSPLFRGQAENDYRLQPFSRLIDRGTVVAGQTYLQVAPDMGAWEVAAIRRLMVSGGLWTRGGWGRGD